MRHILVQILTVAIALSSAQHIHQRNFNEINPYNAQPQYTPVAPNHANTFSQQYYSPRQPQPPLIHTPHTPSRIYGNPPQKTFVYLSPTPYQRSPPPPTLLPRVQSEPVPNNAPYITKPKHLNYGGQSSSIQDYTRSFGQQPSWSYNDVVGQSTGYSNQADGGVVFVPGTKVLTNFGVSQPLFYPTNTRRYYK